MQLSIIIPVYNCATYLKSGFEHLKPLYSTAIDFEIIYVNDGSTDNSLAVLQELQATNKYIQVITQENQGSSGARNTAIAVAKGAYIQFLDADDYIDISKVLSFLEKAIATELDLFGYRIDFVNEQQQQLGVMPKFLVPFNSVISGVKALIAGYQPSSICLFLFKTRFLMENNLRITPKITHMDVEFMLRVMLCAKKVYFVDAIAYHYLQRSGSITKPKTEKKLEQFLYDEVIIANLMRNTVQQTMAKELVKAIEKNYNSVIWNLLWRFIVKPKEVSYPFKVKCIQELSNKKLYPIKGALKTKFQWLSRPLFNCKMLLTTYLIITSK